MWAEMKVPASLCTQVAHCRQVTPLKLACEHAPGEFVGLPQVIPIKIILVQLFSFCSCVMTYFPPGSGELSFQIQTANRDPITARTRCLRRSL